MENLYMEGAIAIVAKLPIPQENHEAFLKLAGELVEKSRQEEGNLYYALNVSKKDENCFAFVESWKNKEAVKAHNATEHFQRILPQLRALCDGEPNTELFTQL